MRSPASRYKNPSRQRGVAIVTALLIATLSIIIVTDLFWKQQVQVRSVENQQRQFKREWLVRSVRDWAVSVLKEDASKSGIDHLGEAWATPVEGAMLKENVQSSDLDAESLDAVISRSVIDAQSRYNLRNLAINGHVNLTELAAFRKLLRLSHLSPDMANDIADAMANAQPQAENDAAAGGIAKVAARPRSMEFQQLEDLLSIPTVSPSALDQLKDLVILLPNPTPVNVNTAPAVVLAARIESLSLDEASTLVESRKHVWFKDPNDFLTRLPEKVISANDAEIDVKTQFFLVKSGIRLYNMPFSSEALVQRNIMNFVRVYWVREG